jgi:hypothetical protein
MNKVRTTIHIVMNHVANFDGPDKAHGIAYRRDEVEYPHGGEWRIGMLQRHDTYRRVTTAVLPNAFPTWGMLGRRLAWVSRPAQYNAAWFESALRSCVHSSKRPAA